MLRQDAQYRSPGWRIDMKSNTEQGVDQTPGLMTLGELLKASGQSLQTEKAKPELAKRLRDPDIARRQRRVGYRRLR